MKRTKCEDCGSKVKRLYYKADETMKSSKFLFCEKCNSLYITHRAIDGKIINTKLSKVLDGIFRDFVHPLSFFDCKRPIESNEHSESETGP